MLKTKGFNFEHFLSSSAFEHFLSNHYRQSYFYSSAQREKIQSLMSWQNLNKLLTMSSIWSFQSLNLVLNKKTVQAADYCSLETGRDGYQVYRPEAGKVQNYLSKGATLVCNDIDQLTPELSELSGSLEKLFYAKAQVNLYCSWKEKPGFDAHFDTHDAFVFHVEGEKKWRIYEGVVENPIAHPDFKNLDEEFHKKHRGDLAEEFVLKPGDFLYIPRGQYHEALAQTKGCVHITCGLTHVIGFDVMQLLFAHLNQDPLFRANVPSPANKEGNHREQVQDYLEKLSTLCQKALNSDLFTENLITYQKEFNYDRPVYTLPEGLSDPVFRVISEGLEIVNNNGTYVLRSKKGAVPIPAHYHNALEWVLKRQEFSKTSLQENVSSLSDQESDKFIQDLQAMKIVN